MSNAGPIGAVSLDQLIALNDEMAALARAGVPLDRGLLAVGRELRGRSGELATRLGGRLERGEGLDAAMEAEGRGLPRFYRAVVAAGLRSGRLTKALEGLAVYAREFAETRRAIGLALLYPALVLILASSLFAVFILFVTPKITEAFATFRLGRMRSMDLFDWLAAHPWIWIPAVPAGVLGLVAWWIWSGRAARITPGRLGGLFRWVPGLGTVLASSQAADFADLLALLVENGVPLDEGMTLAAEATGSAPLRRSVALLAEGLRRGESPASLLKGRPAALPGMLAWVLAGAGGGGPLAPALRHAAETYRVRARRRAEAIQAVLPTLLICVVGALAAALYTLAVFGPITALWYDLSIPVNE